MKQKRPLSSNVYRTFNLNETSDNSNDIFKLIKRLCVNNKDYNNYKHEYTKTTQNITFKKPEIEVYPIIKNDQFIPISRRIFQSNSKTIKKINFNELEQNKTSSTIFFNKEKKDNKNKIFNQNNKDLRTLLLTENSSRNECNKTFRPKSALNLANNNKTFSKKPTLKGLEKIKILRDILFFDESYLDLNYDESEIFYKVNNYNEYVHSRISYFQKEKNKNFTNILKKDYFNYEGIGNYNSGFYVTKENEMKINITLKSMKIEFVNLTNKNKKNTIFNIPFSILPIFYYKNLENLKYLLIACFNFNENFDKIQFDDEGIYHLLEVCPDFSIKITHNNNNNDINRVNSKKEAKISKVKTQKQPKYQKYNIENIKEIKNVSNYLNKYDIYKFIWITPKYNYKVIIRLPEVVVNINKIFITKFVHIELLLYLIKKNFLSWDFYLIHYLFSFKAFRWIIEKTFSNNFKTSNNLDKIYDEKNCGFINFKRVKNNDNNDILYMNLSNERIMKITKTYYTYTFFYTSENNKNGFKILHSFDMEASNPNISEKKFYFKFNFNQMLQLNDISKMQNIYFFFNKLLINDKQNLQIKFNYHFFDHYIPGETYLNTYKPQPIKTNEESKEPLVFTGNINTHNNKNYNNALDKAFFDLLEKEGMFDVEKHYFTKVTFPFLEKLEYERNVHYLGDTIIIGNVTINNNGKNVSTISIDVLDKLNKLPIEEWPEILIKNVKDNIAAELKIKTKRKLTKKGTTINKKGSIAYNLNGSNKVVFNKRNTIMFKQ